jgi:hypothetical protein
VPPKDAAAMNRTLALALACVILLCGCGLMKENEYDFTIKVSGSPGLRFSGHYSILGAGSQPEPLSVTGAVPSEYKGKGIMAIAFFRSLAQDGSLKVEILKEDKIITQSDTSTPYGYVSMKTPLPEKEAVISRLLRRVLGADK